MHVPDINLPLSHDEYGDRLARNHAAMGSAEVDTLFAANRSDMAWQTGYDDYGMPTERHPMQHLAGLLREQGFPNKRIGVEMGNYYF